MYVEEGVAEIEPPSTLSGGGGKIVPYTALRKNMNNNRLILMNVYILSAEQFAT